MGGGQGARDGKIKTSTERGGVPETKQRETCITFQQEGLEGGYGGGMGWGLGRGLKVVRPIILVFFISISLCTKLTEQKKIKEKSSACRLEE